ncbi:hypothetical protein [Streptomyces virginiae]|uniref:hypothetical protein n=1 Tax=Streptomyces virginiae TaxID=1961 RepID=UPI0036ECE19B
MDLQQCGGLADAELGLTHLAQPVCGNGQFLDLLAAQTEYRGARLQRRVDELGGALVRHPGSQARQFGEGRVTFRPGQGVDGGVGHLRVARADPGDLAQRALRQRAERADRTGVRWQEGQQPGQATQGVGVEGIEGVVDVLLVRAALQVHGPGPSDEGQPLHDSLAHGVAVEPAEERPAALLPGAGGLGGSGGPRVGEQLVPPLVRHRPLRPLLADVEHGCGEGGGQVDEGGRAVRADGGAASDGRDDARGERAPGGDLGVDQRLVVGDVREGVGVGDGLQLRRPFLAQGQVVEALADERDHLQQLHLHLPRVGRAPVVIGEPLHRQTPVRLREQLHPFDVSADAVAAVLGGVHGRVEELLRRRLDVPGHQPPTSATSLRKVTSTPNGRSISSSRSRI